MRTARFMTVSRSTWGGLCPSPPGCRLPLPWIQTPLGHVTCDACWEANPPPPDRILDTCLWKHYLPATTVARGNYLIHFWPLPSTQQMIAKRRLYHIRSRTFAVLDVARLALSAISSMRCSFTEFASCVDAASRLSFSALSIISASSSASVFPPVQNHDVNSRENSKTYPEYEELQFFTIQEWKENKIFPIVSPFTNHTLSLRTKLATKAL